MYVDGRLYKSWGNYPSIFFFFFDYLSGKIMLVLSMENEIKSLSELYNRIKPALYSKKLELCKMGLSYIKEEDIWNYLSKNDWANSKDLSLFDMVSDIMHLEKYKIEDYMMKVFKNSHRELLTEEENLL